jgi:acyl carrier protein
MSSSCSPTFEKLISVFRDVFDDEELDVRENTTAQDIEGWDSLTHIRLVVSIERAFSLRFSASDISDLKNVKDMYDLICRKLATV